MAKDNKTVIEISDTDLDKVQGGAAGHRAANTIQQDKSTQSVLFFDEADAFVSKSSNVDSGKNITKTGGGNDI